MKRVFQGQYPYLKPNGGMVMAKMIAGIIIGFIMAADAFMVIFCVWYERRFPDAVSSLELSERRHHCESDSTAL